MFFLYIKTNKNKTNDQKRKKCKKQTNLKLKKGRLMVKSEQQIWGLQYVKCCCLKPLKSSYQTHTKDKVTLYDVQTTACHGKKNAIIYHCHWSFVGFSGLPKAFLCLFPVYFPAGLNVPLSVNHLIIERQSFSALNCDSATYNRFY